MNRLLRKIIFNVILILTIPLYGCGGNANSTTPSITRNSNPTITPSPNPTQTTIPIKILSWSIESVYAFGSNPAIENDGYDAGAGLFAINNILFGTTYAGGYNPDSTQGYGTVYAIYPSNGVESIVHYFNTDYALRPQSNFILANNGLLYGTTQDGYGGGSTNQSGAIFTINPSTFAESVVLVLMIIMVGIQLLA